MTNCRVILVIIALSQAVCLPTANVMAQGAKYSTYREAYSAGVVAVNAGNLAAAREPLEAAAKLAKTPREKMKAYEALMIPYRELQEIEPMQQAAEYVITNNDFAATRSLTRGSLLSFIHKRGKMDVAVEVYEARLKKSPDDRTVLFVLTEAYATYKKDPSRSALLAEKLGAVEKKAGIAQDIGSQAQLAQQYIKAGKLKDGAELFEKIAVLDPKLEAWHFKESAAAWLKSGDKSKALLAAKKSEASAQPESRDALLTYFWHRGLADLFLDVGEPKLAIPHYEKAIAISKIDGYTKDSKAKLESAKAAANK